MGLRGKGKLGVTGPQTTTALNNLALVYTFSGTSNTHLVLETKVLSGKEKRDA